MMIRAFTPLLFAPLAALAQIPAFPGAEGFGAYASGGRGGDVYYVTNLNNNGAGSLRVGLNTAPAEGRTIVFAVSGYIPVVSDTNFNIPANVTIAGQTAPGDGVGLQGGRMLISGSDVVMRHFRIRHGRNGTGGDCLNISGSSRRTIIDHVSMMFSTDENISFFSNAIDDFTMQSSSTAWGMERHNAGGLWDLQDGSCIDSLWAHHRTRNPKSRPYGLLEWVNNVTFHWRNEAFIMGDSQTPADWKTNAIGNYYISIDDPDEGYGLRSTAFNKARVASNNVPNYSLYLADTLLDNDGDGTLNGTDRGYDIVAGSEFTPGDAVGSNRYYKANTPFPGASGLATVSIDDPLTAYKKVVSSTGPLRLDANYEGPLRDELDTLLMDSVVNQYSVLVQKDGKIDGEDPSRPNNGEQHLADVYGITNNGFGTLNGTPAPTDSDLDGMPDSWELALNGVAGIAYNVALDDHNNTFTAGQLPSTFFPAGTPTGYTLLEEYLHFLAVPHATVAKNSAETASQQWVDLARYTDAFTESPSYTVWNVRNGSFAQFAADGTTPDADGPVVRFTPTQDFVGRAGFEFTVVDADGSQWTQQFALLVSSSSVPRDLVWIGDGSGNVWDDVTENWQTASGSPTTFGAGDTAIFDDRGSASPAVNVSGSQLSGSLLVAGAQDYTFSGSGSIASTGTLTKVGDSDLTIAAPASFASGTQLNGGETTLVEGGDLDGGVISLAGGASLTSGYSDSNTLGLDPGIRVESGAVGQLNLSKRIVLNGSLSGDGTLNVFSPSDLGAEGRAYLEGSANSFGGDLFLNGGGSGRLALVTNGGSFGGFPNARVHLEGISLYTRNNSGGNSYPIGSLDGDAASRIVGPYYAGSATWNIGGLGLDSEFAGVISNGTTGQLNHLNKYGSGTLTLSGANSYTGTTAIHEGELRVIGSLGGTNVFVGGGATLSGSGPVGSLLTAQQDSILSPGDEPGEAGTMTSSNGFELNAATMKFDLSSNPASGNDAIVNQAGTLTLRSPGGNVGAHFEFNLIDGFLSPGTYTLVSGGSGTSAPGSPGFTHNLPGNSRQTFMLQRSGGGSSDAYVRLVVDGNTSNLTWTGSSGIWNVAGTTPWTGGASGDNRFYNLDRVTFPDGAVTGAITLSGVLEPQSATVTADSLDYTWSGSGSLGGTATLVKQGDSRLTLAHSGSNSHTGGTIVADGTLALGNSGVGLGSGTIQLDGGTLELPSTATFLDNDVVVTADSGIASTYGGNSTLVDSYSSTFSSTGPVTVDLSGVDGILSIKGRMDGFSGTLDFGSGSGMLRLNSGSSASLDVNSGSADAHFALGTGDATLTNRNGDRLIHLGALSGGVGTHLNGRQSGSGSSATTYRVGALGTDTVFEGTIANGGDQSLHFEKVGDGILTLGGTSSFSGSVRVLAGTLAVPGTLDCGGLAEVENGAKLDLAGGTFGCSSLEVKFGALLCGPGAVDGDLLNNGTIEASAGQLHVSGELTNNGVLRLKSGSSLHADGAVVNNGVLDLLTADGDLPDDFENNGTVILSDGLTVLDAGLSGSGFWLEMMIYEGHRYQLQWSPDLSDGSWQEVGSEVEGNGTTHTFTDSGDEPRGFYRVAVD